MRSTKDAGAPPIFLRGIGPSSTNEALIGAALSGSSTAWELLVDRYERLVWSVIRRYGIRKSDAPDLFQLSFLLLHTHLHQVREPEKLGLWLHTTTRRECVRHLQRMNRSSMADTPIDEIDPAYEGPSPEEEVAAAEADSRLRTSVAQLSPACRKVLELSFRDPPATYDEMATRLNVKRGTVSAKRRRCLDRLGTIYQGQESDE